MGARYQLFRNPRSVLKENREEKLYPRIVRSRIVRLDEMSKRIADCTSFTTSDVKGVWEALRNEIVSELTEGNRVDLEGLGSFFVVLQCREIESPKEIRAESILFSKVAFSPAKKLHRNLRGMELVRAEDYPKRAAYTAGERMERIIGYLHLHPTITSAVCMSLNGCSRDMAQRDLKALYETGRLTRYGGKHVAVYSLKQEEGV